MARARNIKPGFFKNDLLAEINPFGRLLFAGLWTIADRDGRLEDRPKKIKAEVLPYDDCNVEDLLRDLATHGFILRYQVNGTGYIQVVNWAKHQQPHVKEAPGTIPAPDEHSASTVQAPDEHPEKTPDSLNLIPDSSTPQPPQGEPKAKRRRTREEILGPFTQATREVLETLSPEWHREDGPPADRRTITISASQWGEAVGRILASHPNLTPAVLVAAAQKYLREDHLRYKAPQHFFGPEGPWQGYVRSELTRISLQETGPTLAEVVNG